MKRFKKALVWLTVICCIILSVSCAEVPVGESGGESVSSSVTTTTAEKVTTTTTATTTAMPTTTTTTTTAKPTTTTTTSAKPTTTTTTTTPTITTTVTTTVILTTTQDNGTDNNLVWIPTKGGKKYHSHAGCSNMKEPRQVTEDEAEELGFTPCGRCW
ncbi:MAG: hypothetical protein IJO76_03625 [Clostridia bacterium]|nr:hypothetical protein [Clostridia bacterium]